MKKNDFVPKRDGDLDKYEENFVNKLNAHAPTLGIDPGLVTEISTGINSHRVAFSGMISMRAQSKSATEDNLTKKLRSINDMRRGAKIIKSLRNYSPAIGDDLQIIGPDLPNIDVTILKPVLISKVNGQLVSLSYKKNDLDGIKIFCKRNDEPDFSLLALTTVAPFVDSRLKVNPSRPEMREYYAVYFIDVNEVGLVSDRISVTIP
ncbi:MAG: hypothetical protein ABIY50_03275 [Ignavibacteria bacterium]